MLKNEFDFYSTHEAEILEKYHGRFVVIKNQRIIGNYNTQKEAYDESVKKEQLGTFLIQHAIPGATRQTFHTRVVLNPA